jgi:hypothetical protein
MPPDHRNTLRQLVDEKFRLVLIAGRDPVDFSPHRLIFQLVELEEHQRMQDPRKENPWAESHRVFDHVPRPSECNGPSSLDFDG